MLRVREARLRQRCVCVMSSIILAPKRQFRVRLRVVKFDNISRMTNGQKYLQH